MGTFREIDYSQEGEVSAVVIDNTNGNFIWIAFEQDASDNCKLLKASANNPAQIYFSIDVPVTRINRMKVSSGQIYLAVTDSTIFAYKYSLTNPLTTNSAFSFPIGVTESPVDLIIGVTNLFFLTPGVASGENAKIVEVTTAGVLVEDIDLIKSGAIVNNAVSFTVDTNDDFWVITNTSPSDLVRVYENSGAIWNFDITPLG